MKRLLLFICTLLCANVLLAQSFSEGDLIYVITGAGEVEVSSCYYSDTSVNIPSSVTITWGHNDWSDYDGYITITDSVRTYSVTSIGEGAFSYHSSLTSVTIPNSVTSIGNSAFSGCRSLNSITIPNSVTSIGNNAFYNCSGLTSIDIPNSVTSIGEWAFCECSSLTSVTFPNSVTSIGESAFYECSSLTSIDIPNSVTSIGESAFYECSSLTSIDIPNSVTSIGEGAFWGCSSLTSVTIGNSVTSIGEWAFNDCNNLTSVTIGNSVTSIGESAFNDCSSLTSVTIPNSVTSIGNSAFSGCTALQNLTLGENVTSIASGAFSSSSFLQNVTCLATTPPTIADNTVFPYLNIATLTVPCGTLEAYSSPTSFWNMFFMGRISEDGYNVVATANDNAFGSVAVENNCSTATLTAVANACYEFVGWNDGVTENPRSFTLTQDTVFTALFEALNFDTVLSATICEGQTYAENDFIVSEAGVYTLNSQTVNGCDSVVTLNLSVNPIYNTDLVASICEGEVYDENGFNVTEAGIYSRTLQAVNGCDSVVNLTLSVNPIFNTNLSAFICEGETYSENGFNVSEAGTYTQSLQSVLGCDSVVTLTLNVNPVFNTPLTATICEGSVYNENGFNVSEAGTYTQSLQSVNGCDSIVTLTLNVNSVINTSLTATICEGSAYTENGFNVSEAGVYTLNLQTVNGCDSIVTLNLNVNPVYNTDLFASICEGEVYNENGFNVNEAGVYSRTLQAVNGCDSVVNLTLSVNPIFNTNLSAFICEGETYSENGFNVSEAGTYTQSLQSVLGCDSVVTLTLNVNPVFNTPLTATICEGSVYNENGFNVSEAGTYTQSLQSVNGCDSIVTLTLNVTPSYHTNLTATICEGSELNISGFNVTEGGVYTQTYTAVNGCDSIVTLTVTALPVYNTNLTLTICEGTSMNFCGFNVTEGGVYTQTFTAVNGCDSVVTLTVTELPIIHTDLTLSICEGTNLNFSGFNVSEAGVYTQTHTSVNGCDSIVTLTVSVNPTFDTTINATINPGETYAEFGFNESEAGTYVQNLQTEFGCDSTITLVLSVNSSLLEADIEEISFYPNPTDSKVTFSQAIEKVEVIDLTGKVIFTFSNVRTINIESLASGAYYLRLTNDEKTIMQKVIKQ